MIVELIRALNNQTNYLYFMPTARCSASCDFCWNWKHVDSAKTDKRNELTLSEIDQLSKNLPPLLLIDFIGGEPFVRNDIEEVIELFIINAKPKYISIPTNGYSTKKITNTIKNLVTKYPKVFFRLCVSIDGPPEVHNQIRKLPDGYLHALKTSEELALIRQDNSNVSLACNANYNRETSATMEKHITTMMQLGFFDSINFNLIRGNPKDRSLLDVCTSHYFKLQQKIQEYRRISGQPFSPLHKAIETHSGSTIRKIIEQREQQRSWRCYATQKLVLIDDTGNVFPCEEMIDSPIGNLRDFQYSLKTLLKSPKAIEAKKKIANKECSCRWECAISTSAIFNPRNYPLLIRDTAINIFKGGR